MEKYSVIYANPPWMYNKHNRIVSSKNNLKDAKPEYPNKRIPLEEIITFPVQKITEDNCILFLWANTPMLPEALTVVNAWGFVYKTLITWEKINDGCMGYWFKTCTEHLLVAVKGNVKAFGSPIRNCFHEQQTHPGKKPDCFYHLIEKVTNGKKIELFARWRRKGWDAWGTDLEDTVPLLSQLF